MSWRLSKWFDLLLIISLPPTVPTLRQLAVGLLPRWSASIPRQSVCDLSYTGWSYDSIFSRVLWFCPVSIITLLFHSHVLFICHKRYIMIAAKSVINPLKPELNSTCYLLALLAHHFLHVSRIRVKSLTSRRLMSYIYGAPILDVSRSHTTTQHSR